MSLFLTLKGDSKVKTIAITSKSNKKLQLSLLRYWKSDNNKQRNQEIKKRTDTKDKGVINNWIELELKLVHQYYFHRLYSVHIP